MSAANNTHLVRGLNKRGTRMIRVELVAKSTADAMAQVRRANPDAGALSVRTPQHIERVLDLLSQCAPQGGFTPWAA